MKALSKASLSTHMWVGRAVGWNRQRLLSKQVQGVPSL